MISLTISKEHFKCLAIASLSANRRSQISLPARATLITIHSSLISFVVRSFYPSLRRMPYNNPHQDTAGKTETFFRDIVPWDSFTRGSADYAYEVKGVADSMGGFNRPFSTAVEDRELFMSIYKHDVIQEQMAYNNLVFQFNSAQRHQNNEDAVYLQSLASEQRRAERLTKEINKLQADASVERQEDIKRLRAEREETIKRLTKVKADADKADIDRRLLRRQEEPYPSINLPPTDSPPVAYIPYLPDVLAPDATKAVSMKVLLALAVVGAFALR